MISRIDRLARFDRWGPNSNPLIWRVKNRPTRFSLRAALWLAFGLGIGTLAWSFWLLLHTTSDEMTLPEAVALLLGVAVIGLAPPVTAVLAVFQTGHDLQAGQDDLLRITPLPARAVIKAQVFAVLYRLRVLYVMVIGLMPLVAVEMLRLILAMQVVFYRIPSYSYSGGPPRGLAPGVADEMVVWTLLGLAGLLSLWAANLLAAAEGVKNGLLRRNTGPAALSALGGLLLSLLCLCAGWIALSSLVTGPSLVAPGMLALFGTCTALLPLLIGTLAVATIRDTARRWGF